MKSSRTGEGIVENVPAAKWWLSHPMHRWHSEIVCAPPGSPLLPLGQHAHNTWTGFRVQPVQGRYDRIDRHLLQVICAGNENLYHWFMNWMAALVQRPGQHALVAPVFVGGQGAGKGFVADQILGKLFRPDQYIHLGSAGELTADFTEHLAQRIFVFADEAVWGDRHAADRLKRLVTEDTLIIHPKFFPRYEEPSCLHIVIASNADRPLPIESDDRRFAIFQVDDSRKNDRDYFKALYAERDHGGLEGFLSALLDWPVHDAWLNDPPVTSAKIRMKADSMSELDHFWLDCLQSAWKSIITRDDLHTQLVEWWNKHNHRGVVPSREQLGSYFAKHFRRAEYPSWPKPKKVGPKGSQKNAWEFPVLPECQRVFEKATGTRPEWLPEGDERFAMLTGVDSDEEAA
jgi:Mesyanzhinovviridae DNA primase